MLLYCYDNLLCSQILRSESISTQNLTEGQQRLEMVRACSQMFFTRAPSSFLFPFVVFFLVKLTCMTKSD